MPSDGPRVPVAALTRERVARNDEAQAALRVGAGALDHVGLSCSVPCWVWYSVSCWGQRATGWWRGRVDRGTRTVTRASGFRGRARRGPGSTNRPGPRRPVTALEDAAQGVPANSADLVQPSAGRAVARVPEGFEPLVPRDAEQQADLVLAPL